MPAAGSAIAPAVTVAVEDANGNIETGDNATPVTPGHRDQPRRRDLTGGLAVTVVAGSPRSPASPSTRPAPATRLASSTPSYSGGHLVGLQHHAWRGHPAGLHPGPEQHRRRLPHHAGGDGGRRGRQRQHRDRRQQPPRSRWPSGPTPGRDVDGGAGRHRLRRHRDLLGPLHQQRRDRLHPQRREHSVVHARPPRRPSTSRLARPPSWSSSRTQQHRRRLDHTPAVTVAVEDAIGNVETATTHPGQPGPWDNPGTGRSPGARPSRSRPASRPSPASPSTTPRPVTRSRRRAPRPTQQPPRRPSTSRPGPRLTWPSSRARDRCRRRRHHRPGVTVAVEDANGNVETADNATTGDAGPRDQPRRGALTGGSAVTVSGRRHVPGPLSQQGRDRLHTDRVEHPDLTAATSSAFNITPGPPTQLAFVQNPSNTRGRLGHRPAGHRGRRGRQRQRGDRRQRHHRQPGHRDQPERWDAYRRLRGTVSAGVATFSGLSINKVGNRVHADRLEHPARTRRPPRRHFNITPGAATHLVFVQGPCNAVAGAAIAPAVTVAVEDANGNVETADSTTQVTLAIGTKPAAGCSPAARP